MVLSESPSFSIKNASSIRFLQNRPSAGFADLALFSILNADSSILSETWLTYRDYHFHILILPQIESSWARVTPISRVGKSNFPGPNKIESFSRCAICFNFRAISVSVLVFSIFSDFSNSGRSKAVMESITISLTLLTKHLGVQKFNDFEFDQDYGLNQWPIDNGSNCSGHFTLN